MECAHTEWLSTPDYLAEFNRRTAEQRVPVCGSIDLTHRCNLRCVHCYVRPRSANQELEQRELSTERLVSILDEIADAGCLYLLITGGEPLLRRDFPDVYCHAKMKGMLVTVFTNGTLISDETLALFRDLPPHQVEISLYGATAETYGKITGAPGAFEHCLGGIERLLAAGLNVRLKTVLMTLNRHELPDIERMAEELGVEFRFDPAIFPRLDGDRAPIRLRIPAEEAVEKELADEVRLRRWRDYFRRRRDLAATDALYQCGAGLTYFHIDPYGNLRPCLMINEPAHDLRNGSFLTGWRDVMPRIRQRKARANHPCNACEKRVLCGFCPAFFALENGAADDRSEYVCEMGHARFRGITEAEMASRQPGGRHVSRREAREEARLREAPAPHH